MTERLPSSLDGVLRSLYQVSDALDRKNIVESVRHVNDSLAKVRNEMDWTLNSDPNLPYLLQFLEALSRSLNMAVQTEPSCRGPLITTIIEEIDSVTTKVTRITNALDAYPERDGLPDDLEKQQLRRKYDQST